VDQEDSGQSTERIEALRALMDRLVSPDLTLGEARGLRCRLLALTGGDQAEEAALGTATQAASFTIGCEGRRNDSRSPGCRDCAA
jgi:hypothetical protein